MDDFVKNFKQRSRHHSKLINFIYPELIKLNGTNILEFGVSEQAMSSELFLNFSDSEEFNVYSIDNVNYQNKFKNKNWNFIHSRDDDFEFVKKNLPEQFSLILLDTIVISPLLFGRQLLKPIIKPLNLSVCKSGRLFL